MIIPSDNILDLIKNAINIKDMDEHAIGMALAKVFDNQYFRLDYINEGFIASLCMEFKPWNIITEIVDLIRSDRYNYNDMDCDLYGFTSFGDQKCLCKVLKDAGIFESNYKCPCIDGVSPNFYKHYFLIHSNHGNAYLYHVIKDQNSFYHSIDIRRLKYNQSSEELVNLGNLLAASVSEDDVNHELLRYKDSRDIGFSLSFRCNRTYDGVANIDVTKHSGYDIEYITAHLNGVLKDIKNENKA